MPPADNRVVMPIIVVNEAEGEVVIFRREAEGVFGEEVAIGDAGGAGGAGDGAEGGIIVVGGEAVGEGVVDEVGDVLVAVVGVVGRDLPIGHLHHQRAGGDRFRGVPDIGVEEGVVGATELLDAKLVVVDETLKRFLSILHRAHFDTAAHAVEGHMLVGACIPSSSYWGTKSSIAVYWLRLLAV